MKNITVWKALEILFFKVSSVVPLVTQPPDNTRRHIHIPKKTHGLLRAVNFFVSQPGTIGESLLDMCPMMTDTVMRVPRTQTDRP